MKDKEKILRWNLQRAQEEIDKPLDIAGNMIASWAFGIIDQRKSNLNKCQTELDEYLNQNKDE